MAILRATVTLNMKSGVPEDAATNVWHFLTEELAPYEDSVAGLLLFLPAFYQDPDLAAHWSQAVSRAALVHTCQVSTVTTTVTGPDDDIISRVIADTSFTISTAPTGGTHALPSEVACCLSFQGDVEGVPEESGGTRPAARRRGRVYLGPLNSGAGTEEVATGRYYANLQIRQTILPAYLAMVASLKSLPEPVIHGVYSPSFGAVFQSIRAHVDDAWDTMRSRGQLATLRDIELVP